MILRNPVWWGSDQLAHAGAGVRSAIRAIHRPGTALPESLPAIRKIGAADLKDALAQGFRDFTTYRTDVMFLCVVYPIIGIVLARLVIGQGLFELLFPLASGFALIGPLVAVGLYEMSRRRERGETVGWGAAFGVLRSPSTGGIAFLGLVLLAIFFLWLFAAESIYGMTVGPMKPHSMTEFDQDVIRTGPGWAMILIGMFVGLIFAVVVFALTVVSFPLLLDRHDVGVDVAVGTSIRTIVANPGTMALWALIVAGSLALGSLPFFLGLAFAIPILGHATWHLYRKLVVPAP